MTLRQVSFMLPFALPSGNARQRTHWAERMRQQKRLSQEVMVAIGGPRYFPRPPFERARVTIVRCSAGTLDTDNLYASCKPLADVLCVNSARHTVGLGIIADDNPKQCELVARQLTVKEPATVVRVEELEPLPPDQKSPRRKQSGSKLPQPTVNTSRDKNEVSQADLPLQPERAAT